MTKKPRQFLNLIVASTLVTLLAACVPEQTPVQEAEQPTAQQLQREMLKQRATQAVFWGMPAASMMAMRRGVERDLGADFHDIIYMSAPMVSRHAFFTVNNQTPYAFVMLDTTQGPVVIEVPAASPKAVFFGSVNDAWLVPVIDVGPQGEDEGKGGKFLFLPPGYDGEVPEGYIVSRPETYHTYMALRPVAIGDGKLADAVEYSKRLRVYPLDQADDPAPNRYIDAFPLSWDSIPRYDLSFFQDIATLVAEEPVQPKDMAMMGMLEGLGIEKGKPFAPDAAMQAILGEAAKLAGDTMQANFLTPGWSTVAFWPDSRWGVFNLSRSTLENGFKFADENQVFLEERARTFHWLTFPPKKLGKGSFYLTSMLDKSGNVLGGGSTYRLHVPAGVPVGQFWSISTYSLETKAFIAGADKVGISSYEKESLKYNDDGSIDLYFAPTTDSIPQGMEGNWLSTGVDFFLMCRFYSPQPALFQKTWSMPDLELLP